MKRHSLLLLGFIILACGLAALAIGKRRGMSEGQVIVTGKALIGGPFTLTDHTGKRVTEKDFAGKFTLVFFGYTSCPDICPAELQVISAALDQLGERAKNVTPLFITVDPERDTVRKMASYVGNFHERLVGLTGSVEEIRAVVKAYRIYSGKVEHEHPGGKAEHGHASSEYLLDHSSVVYLMSPAGEYLAHFSYGAGAGKMAKGIAEFL